MSQGGPNNTSGSGSPPIETLTGNSGGAVSPDGAFNIDIVGNNATGIDIVGTPASNLLTVAGIGASTTQIGTVELSTDAEAIALIDTTRAITPSNLAAVFAEPPAIGSTTPNDATFTQLDVDNININGNTISSTDVNGNISLEPNGAGATVIPSNNLYVGSASPSNPYNIAIEDSVSGAIGESIQNTSVGASASSTLQLIVEPATADPYTLFNVNGASNFALGIDNSDSDQLKITTGSTPSAGTTALNITNAGVVTLPGAALDVPSGGTGATSLTDHGVVVGSGTAAVSVTAVGSAGEVLTSNGAGMDPTFQAAGVSGPGSSTDNALARWDGTGGDTLQDSTVIVTDAGEMTNASQPAFLAYLATNDNNQTGNGTVFFLGDTDVGTTLTEVFDQNADFTPGASGGASFVAPVSGRYFLKITVLMGEVATSTDAIPRITTSNRDYYQYIGGAGLANASNQVQYNLAAIADMDVTDTAQFATRLDGIGADTADVLGGATQTFTNVSGYLIC